MSTLHAPTWSARSANDPLSGAPAAVAAPVLPVATPPEAPAGASSPALSAYEALAAHYDDFTAPYQHERWLAALEALAREHGLRGRRLLDVGCGTGKSFAPLLRRGYETTACDLSPAMVAIARARFGGRVRLFVADMRTLPPLGRFDLITCLDDAVNYLLEADELAAALASMRRCLAPDGLLVFDVNTLAAYREGFTASYDRREGALLFRWRGDARHPVSAGAILSATIEVCEGADPDHPIAVSRHVQRHHPPATVRAACATAGLEPVAVWGQHTGVRLEPGGSDDVHAKLVWLARRRRSFTARLAHRAEGKEDPCWS